MENKPTHKIMNSLKHAVFHNWIFFNAFNLFWFVVVFSTLYLFEHGILSVIALIILGVLFYLIDDVKFDVAERLPRSFLRFENVKRNISKIYWRFIYPVTIVLFLIYYFLPSKYPSYAKEIGPIFIPVFAGFAVVFVGTTIYQVLMIGNVRQQPRMLKARAEATFRVLAVSLKNPSIKKHGKVVGFLLRAYFGKRTEDIEEKKKWIMLFENGMNDLNVLFINRFNFEFCNPNKYSDYFRFVIWSEDSYEVNRIRKVIDIMGYNLRKKIELSDVLWTTRQILMEKSFVSKEEMFQDLDFKTGINRWYNHNKEGVKLALLIIPVIVSIVALLYQFVL
jgi:hypothetical protein